MPSARIVYPLLQLLAIAAFVVGLLSDDPTLFFALGLACICAALVAFLARERAKTRRP